MKYLIPIVIVLALVAAGCTQPIVGENTTAAYGLAEPNLITGGEPVVVAAPGDEAPQDDEYFTITKTEGDLVLLKPEAIDPDGDAVTYSFSAPFDKLGRWQTGYGDAGDHVVTVTATDTKGASASTPVMVRITPANRPPQLDCPPEFVVKEGETVSIDCSVSDHENEEVLLTFEGWMLGQRYETTYEDAGTHKVTVLASDGFNDPVEKQVKVIVQDVNRAPFFPLDFADKIVATEGDIITIDNSEIMDPDGDRVTFSYSQPFDEKGVWKTELGDAGTYPVDVVASDGHTTAKQRINVVVKMLNTAPVLKRLPDMVVTEGDTVRLDLDATDREGDRIEYTVSGWMTTTQYTTTYTDAGTYTVKVTASDGLLADSQVVHITVENSNRAPVFKVPA